MKLVMRRRNVAEALNVSQAQVMKFDRAGWLHPVNLKDTPFNIRCVVYDPEEVEALAKRLLASNNQEACA
jgi:hypothetical protein